MTELTHPELVQALCKPGSTIAAEMSADDAHILHMAIGIAGEAGELLDAIKKIVIYQKAPDMLNIIEELGDLEFYMEGLRKAFMLSRDETLQANKKKLTKRYQSLSYSDRAAQDRADKA